MYLDYVGVRTFDDVGNVTGERRLIGLFTSTAYASSVLMLPSSRPRQRRAGGPGHARGSPAKNLLQILEDYPRDELFQDSPEHLLDVTTQVSKLQERRGSQVFVRSDEFGRFVSALVYVPRDRYNTPVRLRIESLLTESYGAEFIEHTAKVGDSPLAQLHCMLRMPRGVDIPSVDVAELNAGLEAAIRTWDSGFVDALHRVHDEEVAAGLFARYGAAFPSRTRTPRHPTRRSPMWGASSGWTASGGIAVHLYAGGDDPRRRFLRVVSTASRPLTEVLPMLTALGVQVIDDRPQDVSLMDGSTRHISDFALSLHDAEMWGDDARAAFERAFLAIWSGAAEGDSLNALVLQAGVDWRDVVILRAIGAYLRQIGSAFSMDYIDQARSSRTRRSRRASSACSEPGSTPTAPMVAPATSRSATSCCARWTMSPASTTTHPPRLRRNDRRDGAHELLPTRRRGPPSSRGCR